MAVLRSDFLVLVTILIVMLLVVDRHVAPPPDWKDPVPAAAIAAGSGPGGGAVAMTPDPENGRSLFAQTCTSCHGAQAQGLPHQGVDLRISKFVAELNDSQLVKFLKTGRQPKDPKSVRGLIMPPLGGNPSLVEMELGDIVAFLRVVQKEARAPTSRPSLTSAAPLQGSLETQ
jgi:mono/diheme cytochrome c family protein